MPATTQQAIELIFEFNNQYQYYWSASIMASLETIMENAMVASLNIASREIADGFASRAGQFAERVRRNTLAVLAVNHYLSWQGIETNLEAGKSWNPALRLLSDVADLHVKNVGRLECRVIAPGATTIDIPLEVSKDRVAYMVLELSEKPLGGKLLGLFVPGAEPVYSISLSDLKDMDESIEYLYDLQSAASADSVASIASTESTVAAEVKKGVIEVSKWFNGELDSLSESLNAVLSGSNFAASGMRSGEELSIRERVNEHEGREIVPSDSIEVKFPIVNYNLHILTWKSTDNFDRWGILAAVSLASEKLLDLPIGLSIEIDENGNFSKRCIEEEDLEILYNYVISKSDSNEGEISISITTLSEKLFSATFTFDALK
jgi:Protein of unknown function (DUF1822)